MANVTRAPWADEYAIIVDVPTNIYDQVSADTSAFNDATVGASYDFETGKIGVDSNKYGIQLNNHPTFDPGQNIIDQEKAIGTSYRRAGAGYEFQQGTRLPTTTFEFDVTEKNIVPFLWTLFQKGLDEGAASVYLKTFGCYLEAEDSCEAYMTLLRKMSDEDTNSHVIGGAICRSMTLSATSGEPLRASCEMIGYNMVTDFDFNAQSSIIEYDNSAPLLWQNATVELDDSAINIDGFSITITNNAVPKFYDSQHPVKYVLGRITVDGTITIPWGDTNKGSNTEFDHFVAGTDAYLEIYWGNETPSADNDFKIFTNMRYTGATNTGDDEIGTELPFVGAYDGTYPDSTYPGSIIIYSGESVNRSVP